MIKQRQIVCCLFVFLLVLGVACSERKQTITTDQYRIVATTGMIADIAKELVGSRAEVKQLIGTGVDPHLYKPTRSDLALLHSADIVLYNGLLLEGKMTDALNRLAQSGKKVHALGEQVDSKQLIEPAGFSGHYDPHLWMDPVIWSKIVDAVLSSLIDYDPSGETQFRQKAEGYRSQLAKLDAYAQEALGSIPEQSRVLVTAHDAFSYFGRRYGFEVVGIQGLSTESEAGVLDIERIVNLLVKRKIPAVFIESTVSDRNVQALLEGAAAQDHRVQVGGTLFSDAMGKPGTYRGTYVGMIDHNITTISRALQGKAPAGGMLSKLESEE